MAKLYWRVKRNGKWTWKPARRDDCKCGKLNIYSPDLEEEE